MKKFNKRFLSLALILALLLPISSGLGGSFSAAANDKAIQSFIDGALDLLRIQPEPSFQSQSAEVSEFGSSRLIIKSAAKPDRLNSVGMASGFLDYHIVQFKNEADAKAAYDYYAVQKSVEYVEPDEKLFIAPDPEPITEAAPKLRSQSNGVPESLNSWGAESTGLYAIKQYLNSNNIALREIVVAVLDTGVDLTHEFLQGRLIRTGFNATRYDDPNSEQEDEDPHGTMVTSVIVDATPENVKVANYKVLGEILYGEDHSPWVMILGVAVLQAVEDGVDIINMSLGIDTASGARLPELWHVMFRDVFSYAHQQDIVLVAAAGNLWHDIADLGGVLPANSNYVITAAAHREDGSPCEWSNYGANVAVTAPGEDVPVAVIPNEMYADSYSLGYGTSFSVPFTSAACAIALALNPGIKPDDLRDLLYTQSAPWDSSFDHEGLWGGGLLDAFSLSGLAQAAEPIPNLAAGKYIGPQTLTLTAEEGSEIYYTLDGTLPSKESSARYIGPITLEDDYCELMAVAYREGVFRSSYSPRYAYRVMTMGTDDVFAIDDTGTILQYTGTIKQLVIPQTVLGKTVINLHEDALVDSGVEGILLPDTVAKLSVADTALNFNYKGYFALSTTIQYVEGNGIIELSGPVFLNSSIKNVSFPNLESITEHLTFAHTANLASVSFPKLKTLGAQAFRGSMLKSAYLPRLNWIGLYAFTDCSQLRALSLPSLTSIANLNEFTAAMNRAFSGFSGMTGALDLPELDAVPHSAFMYLGDYYGPRRFEFSKLRIMREFPYVDDFLSVLTLVLPSTFQECMPLYQVHTSFVTFKRLKKPCHIYGTPGTYAEQWANENAFTFTPVSQETAVMEDLPRYYKSYMGELEADVIGFNRSYQWYASNANSNTGGTAISGAVNKKFNPADFPPAPYYYCVVTSTDVGYAPIQIRTSACENRSVRADYSSVEAALAQVPADLSAYTPESRLALENAINAIVYGLEISHQSEVDAFANALVAALTGLTIPNKPKPVISQPKLEVRYKGTAKLSVSGVDSVVWASLDKKIADVDQYGNVKGLKRGVTTVTATANGQFAPCEVTVVYKWWQWLIIIFLFGWIWY